MPGPVLVPILGDQLTRDLASLRGRSKEDSVILMMEVWDEATYVRHHKQKIALIFAAMRHFAEELRGAGWRVDYTKLGHPDNAGSFTGELARAIERHDPRRVSGVEAGEGRVRQDMEQWADKFACEIEILRDDRFLCSQSEFDAWAEDRKELRMEFFYREMRRKTGLLMAENGKPTGGEWNYDSENRKPPKDGLAAPERPRFEPDAVTQKLSSWSKTGSATISDRSTHSAGR
jgi:deoxyribodipyrimidine photolyase-related protein